MFIVSIGVLEVFGSIMFLLSRFSPIKILRIRKKLILFTRRFIKSKADGIWIYSVKWRYTVKGKKVIIDLYPNGLIENTADTGRKLSQCLGLSLYKYEEFDNKMRYIFQEYPKRYDGLELISEGVTEYTGEYRPALSHKPIPLYDNILWKYCSEALHILLIAPTGAGKSLFIRYLGGMALKFQHMLYVIDAKNSDLGRLFRQVGVQVATNIDQIIELLTVLVQEMEERYAKYFSSDNADIDADFASLGLQGHILFFDEVLAALGQANAKQKAEIERLLGQLALKGRAVGISLVLTAQKLNATDLPKAITEQCQTRIILGKVVSDETFHQATGYYKKDILGVYKGGVGKGYIVTPESNGLSYIKTPFMPKNAGKYITLFKELSDRGRP